MQLLGVSKELGNRFSKVMAAHDIATFGALCALATFDPIEFKAPIFPFFFSNSPFTLHRILFSHWFFTSPDFSYG